MPVGALTSIAHRISGVLLALGLPLCLYLLDLSVQSPKAYARVNALFDGWTLKAVALVFIWALAHHLLAGVRHLLTDIGVGSRLSVARRSARTVNVAGFAVVLLAAWALR